MSVAFTKEDSAETAAETVLPDRPVSAARNLVTAAGLAALHQQLDAARAALDAASSVEDINERRRQSAVPMRDLRYFADRLRTAEPMPEPEQGDLVSFGSLVSIRRDDGRELRYRIVGEDEADPKAGTLSYVSPMAAALLGRSVGEVLTVGGREVEIVAIA